MQTVYKCKQQSISESKHKVDKTKEKKYTEDEQGSSDDLFSGDSLHALNDRFNDSFLSLTKSKVLFKKSSSESLYLEIVEVFAGCWLIAEHPECDKCVIRDRQVISVDGEIANQIIDSAHLKKHFSISRGHEKLSE